jgi:hypothetical protein
MLERLFLRQVPDVRQLRAWNWWLAGIYALQAAGVLLLGTGQSFSIIGSYLALDSLQSSTSGSFVLAPASHHLFDIDLLWVAASIFIVLAFLHVIQATGFRVSYEGWLKKNFNPLRWSAYGFSASMLFLALAVLAGAYDVMALILLLVLGVVLHALCIGVERMAALRGNARIGIGLGFGLIVVCGAGMWLIVASYLVGANVFGDGHIPASVYWLAITAALTALSFAFGLYRQIVVPKTGARYRLTELRYMILTAVTTSLLAWQIVAGTMH